VAAATPPEAQAPAAWRVGPAGLEIRVLGPEAVAEHPAWPARVTLVRLDPRRHRLELVQAARAATEGRPALRPVDLAGRDDVLAAINGGYFDERRRPLGWRVAEGVETSPRRPAGGASLVVDAEGVWRILAPDERAPAGVRLALQCGPRLVVRSRPTALKPQVAERSFVALAPDGRLILGCTAPAAVSLVGLAEFLAAPASAGGLGVADALNLDGGSSASLFVRHGSADGGDIDLPGIPVPDVLAVRGR
jgi:uncharacterized protein YigE (DUF2233 family)